MEADAAAAAGAVVEMEVLPLFVVVVGVGSVDSRSGLPAASASKTPFKYCWSARGDSSRLF